MGNTERAGLEFQSHKPRTNNNVSRTRTFAQDDMYFARKVPLDVLVDVEKRQALARFRRTRHFADLALSQDLIRKVYTTVVWNCESWRRMNELSTEV